jgi:hypothetical protein
MLMIFLQDWHLKKPSSAFISLVGVNFFNLLDVKYVCLDFLLDRIPCPFARSNNPDLCHFLLWPTNTHDKERHGLNETSRLGLSNPFW